MQESKILEVKNLKISYTSKRKLFRRSDITYAVKGGDFFLNKGEILGIVGESGCGKTSIARCLVGLIEPASGKITFNSKQKNNFCSVQMVFQDSYASLNPRMSIFATVSEAVKISRQFDEVAPAVINLFEQVGISKELLYKYPHELSGGQRQRVAIARALATKPEILIADEPVSALDVSIQAQILNLLKDLQKAFKLSIIFISHDLTVVNYLADRVMVMKDGEIVEVGKAEEITNNPTHDYTKFLYKTAPSFDLL